MTVAELIEYLQEFPGDLHVIVPGYEDGYDDVTLVRLELLLAETNDQQGGIFGKYSPALDEEPGSLAVLIAGVHGKDRG